MKNLYILLLVLILPLTVFSQKVFHKASPFDSYVRGEGLTSKGNQYFILPTLEARKEPLFAQNNELNQLKPIRASTAKKGEF